MSNPVKAILFGLVAGVANIFIYRLTTQHILIFIPYVMLMLTVTAWMFRERIAPFRFRVRIALTAFTVTTVLTSAFAIVSADDKVTLPGAAAGLGITAAIGAVVSFLSALLSGRSRNEALRYSSSV